MGKIGTVSGLIDGIRLERASYTLFYLSLDNL